MILTKIKEFSILANNANKLGLKEVKLSKELYNGLLSEINFILADELEKTLEKNKNQPLQRLNGGSFK